MSDTEKLSREESELAELEEAEFDEFYDKIEQFIREEQNGEALPVFSPDSRLKARDWVYAFVKIKEDIEFYKEKYIPWLTEKYIKPVRDKIEKHIAAQEYIKDGLFEFLEAAEEKKVVFPDLATVSKAKVQPKLIYPEDESALLQQLIEEESEFVIKKPALDKKTMLAQYKKTGEVPVDGLVGEAETEAIRITVAKSRKKEDDE